MEKRSLFLHTSSLDKIIKNKGSIQTFINQYQRSIYNFLISLRILKLVENFEWIYFVRKTIQGRNLTKKMPKD